MQAGQTWHFDGSETLTCQPCEFKGHDPVSDAATSASIGLYNSSITCVEVLGAEAQLLEEAAATLVRALSPASKSPMSAPVLSTCGIGMHQAPMLKQVQAEAGTCSMLPYSGLSPKHLLLCCLPADSACTRLTWPSKCLQNTS